jgi:inner membrane protein
MALCFTHATAGYLVYEAVRPAGPHRPLLLAASVLLANAPDLDFLPGLVIGEPAAFHRGPTHSLAGVALVVVVATALGWRRPLGRGPAWWAGFAAAAYGAHLVVDFLTVDARAPYGAPLFWPLSDRFHHSGLALFGEIVIDPSGRLAFVRSLLTPLAMTVWLREVAFATLVVAAVTLVRALARSRLPRFAE